MCIYHHQTKKKKKTLPLTFQVGPFKIVKIRRRQTDHWSNGWCRGRGHEMRGEHNTRYECASLNRLHLNNNKKMAG